jgi:hypothetical protein
MSFVTFNDLKDSGLRWPPAPPLRELALVEPGGRIEW